WLAARADQVAGRELRPQFPEQAQGLVEVTTLAGVAVQPQEIIDVADVASLAAIGMDESARVADLGVQCLAMPRIARLLVREQERGITLGAEVDRTIRAPHEVAVVVERLAVEGPDVVVAGTAGAVGSPPDREV